MSRRRKDPLRTLREEGNWPERQLHEYIRNGTAKLLTPYHPASERSGRPTQGHSIMETFGLTFGGPEKTGCLGMLI